MATPTPSRPGRPLAVTAVVVVALVAWMVITGITSPKLGLDLQGGTSVTLIPKPAPGGEAITNEQIDQAVEIIRQRVNGLGVAEAEVTTQGQGAEATIVVSIPGASVSDIAEQVGQTAQLNFRPVSQEGSGAPIPAPTPTPSASGSGKPSPSPRSGKPSPSPSPTVSETPSPSPSGSASGNPRGVTSGLTAEADTAASKQAPTTAELVPVYEALDCSDPANTTGFQDDPALALTTCTRDGITKYLLEKAAVLGTNIDNADATINNANGLGEWAVDIDFDDEGTKAFAEITRDLVDNTPPTNQFAIVLDGLVVSAPRVISPILDGNAQITGQFTQEEAESLANKLKYGALPLAFDVGEAQQISPTLGSDQLTAGLLAGALGLFLVVLYSLLYYRGLGIVTVVSLTIAGILTYGLIVLLGEEVGFTLTLAGIAGTIVAIGITADSFVVYFERLRDEVRDGRSLRGAVETGMGPCTTDHPGGRRGLHDRRGRAVRRLGGRSSRVRVHPWTHDDHRCLRGLHVHEAVRDPSGPHLVLRQRPSSLRARSRETRAQGPRALDARQGGVMSRFGEISSKLYRGEVSYDFVGHRRRWYAISAVIVLVSIGALWGRGLTPGIEFEGGAVFIVPTADGTVSEAQDAVTAAGITGESIVTEVNGQSGRSLRVQTESLTGPESVEVTKSLASTFDVTTDEITAQLVGPSWGDEITNKALRGLVYFLILVVIFLSVYFEWRMAVAALVALAHDLIITVGIYALIGFTVTPATVIGVLTILGYSLYDTVVVFDKVKENTKGIAGGSKMTYSEAANLAVNQTLVRSINTSVIALLPVASILIVAVGFLGTGTLKDLSLALFVGIATGTYSSIFIATPFLAQLKERDPQMQALAKRVEAKRSAGARAAAGQSATATTAAVAGVAVLEESPGSAPAATTKPSGNRQQPKRKGAGSRPGSKKRR